LECNENNNGVNVIIWYGTTDCTGRLNSFSTTNGITDFNCIGTDSCYADFWYYTSTNMSDPTCSTASTFPNAYFTFATGICTYSEGYGVKFGCHDSELDIAIYDNNTDCSIDPNEQVSLLNGCTNHHTNSSMPAHYIKLGVLCLGTESTTTTTTKSADQSSGSSGNAKVIIGAVVGLSVFVLIVALLIVYFTRRSRLGRKKMDKTGGLIEHDSQAVPENSESNNDKDNENDEMFNDESRGIRGANTSVNTGRQPNA